MKLTSNPPVSRTHASSGPPLPRPKTKRESRALYKRIGHEMVADEIRDRIRGQMGYEPSKASVGALAQATLDELGAELQERLREPPSAQQFRCDITHEGLESLAEVARLASGEAGFASELTAMKLMLECEKYVGVTGYKWDGNKHVETYGNLIPNDVFLRGAMKAVGLYSDRLFGISIQLGGRLLRTTNEIALAAMSIACGSQ
jgi:hypothetical protein